MVNLATVETVENYFFKFTGYGLKPRRVLNDGHSRGGTGAIGGPLGKTNYAFRGTSQKPSNVFISRNASK